MVPNDCEVIYSLKRGTKKLIEQELDNVELFSADATLLIAYQQLLPPNKELQSFIRLMDNDILITIYKNKKLQLHQLYEIKNLDDALYFYLNALVTLGLNQKEIFASILGNHKDLEEYKSLLSRNIASVKFANRLPTLQYADEIFSYPSHSFFNLFALVLCA
jgi:hypothetical protein